MSITIEISGDPTQLKKKLIDVRNLIKFLKKPPILDCSSEPWSDEIHRLSTEFANVKVLTSCLGNIPSNWIWYPTWLIKIDLYPIINAKKDLPSIRWHCWIRRPRLHRIDLIKELQKTNLLGTGEFVCPHSLNEKERNAKWDNLEHSLGSWDEYKNLILDSIDITPGTNACLIPNYKLRQDRALDLISETVVEPSEKIFLSEKTWKAVRAGQLFLLWGQSGAVEELRKLGFKTFDKFINHNYDNEKDTQLRLQKCINELQRLLSLTEPEWCHMWESTYEDRIFNQTHFKQDWKKYLSDKLSDN